MGMTIVPFDDGDYIQAFTANELEGLILLCVQHEMQPLMALSSIENDIPWEYYDPEQRRLFILDVSAVIKAICKDMCMYMQYLNSTYQSAKIQRRLVCLT